MVKRDEKHKTIATTTKFHRWLKRKRLYEDRTFEATLKRLMGVDVG